MVIYNQEPTNTHIGGKHMTVTIMELDKNYLGIGSKDKRFAEHWGSVLRTSRTGLFDMMESITIWANNEMKEAVLFEVG